jgi:hypothetical protein
VVVCDTSILVEKGFLVFKLEVEGEVGLVTDALVDPKAATLGMIREVRTYLAFDVDDAALLEEIDPSSSLPLCEFLSLPFPNMEPDPELLLEFEPALGSKNSSSNPSKVVSEPAGVCVEC